MSSNAGVPMKVDGRCHCGKIEFEAEVDPTSVNICHCTDCQSLSGSAFRISIPALAAAFILKSGEPKVYVKAAESGAKRVQAFCGDCGSPIYSCAAEMPKSYSLRVGLIRQRHDLFPNLQIWRRSALRWIDDFARIPAAEKED
jgi:hypothetical protein